MEIKIDTRELTGKSKDRNETFEIMVEIIEKINEKFKTEHTVIEESLELGDIRCGDVIIELKTFPDFVSSLKDERFRGQLFNMYLNDDLNCFYFIHGSWNTAFEHSKIHPHSLLGAIASIFINYGVKPITFPNKNYALYTAYKIFEKMASGTAKQPKTFKTTSDLRAINMLRVSAPRFQEKAAIGALEEFGSVKEVINADYDALIDIKHLGEKTIKEFLKTINLNFKVKKDLEIDLLKDFDIEGDMINE